MVHLLDCEKDKDVGIGPEGWRAWCFREVRLLFMGKGLMKLDRKTLERMQEA